MAMVMTNDRRCHERIEVPWGLVDDEGIWANNISETGMSFCCWKVFQPGTIIEITLALPLGKQKVSARVIWCQRALSFEGRKFVGGVVFLELSRATQRAIKAYIADYSDPPRLMSSLGSGS